jgi:hypothetical protein
MRRIIACASLATLWPSVVGGVIQAPWSRSILDKEVPMVRASDERIHSPGQTIGNGRNCNCG